MTECFLKPNAKTAFVKAFLDFCTANQLFKFFLLREITACLSLQGLESQEICIRPAMYQPSAIVAKDAILMK